jgi:hypothetical protein
VPARAGASRAARGLQGAVLCPGWRDRDLEAGGQSLDTAGRACRRTATCRIGFQRGERLTSPSFALCGSPVIELVILSDIHHNAEFLVFMAVLI